MIQRLCKTIFLMTTVFLLNVLATNQSSEDIQKIVNSYAMEHNQTGILLLVDKNGSAKHFSAGYANRETKKKIQTDDLFEIGSASKLFTAMAIFQLIEAKKISLDTSLGVLYPKGKIRKLANLKGQNYWDEVTVGMLLNHTSGFVDYLNIYHDDAKAIKIFAGKSKVYNYDTIIDLALNAGDAEFRPGSKFAYSNTGYVILGDIISKVSGIPWRDYIQKNIFDKAGVKHTYFGTLIPKAMRDQMPQGYNAYKPTYMPMALADSAGEVISTLDDLSRLITMWKDGAFYKKKETLQRQLTQGFHLMSPYATNLSYGYGTMKIEDFYGHGGQTFSFQSYVTINPKTNTTYIIGVNDAQVGSMDLFMKIEDISFKPVIKKP